MSSLASNRKYSSEELKEDDILSTSTKYHILDPYYENELGGKTFVIFFKYAGSFFIQIQYKDVETDSLIYTPPSYIFVEPLLHPTLKQSSQPLNPSSLSILTVLSRSLGKVSNWKPFFKTQKALHYNAIHFTPI